MHSSKAQAIQDTEEKQKGYKPNQAKILSGWVVEGCYFIRDSRLHGVVYNGRVNIIFIIYLKI